jgi:hypothetical protein
VLSAAGLNYHYYLATKESLKDLPRVKLFNDFIVSRSSVLKQVLRGHAPKT